MNDLTPRNDPKAGIGNGGAYSDNPKLENGFIRSNLFVFMMGQVVTILIAIVFFAVGWGKLSQQFVESMEWRGVTQARLERMDKEGTNADRYGFESERARIDNMDGRLKAVEENTRKLDVMASTLDRLDRASNPKK